MLVKLNCVCKNRASIRYDTVSVLGVSLNVKERTYAVVWNFGGMLLFY